MVKEVKESSCIRLLKNTNKIDYNSQLTMKNIFFSLGSNSGKRFTNIHKGISDILSNSSIIFLGISPVYFTEPVDHEKQNWFVNTILKVYTNLSPFELLNYVKGIESTAGRVKTVPKGPRIIDIDILLYDNEAIISEDLIIPHPELHKRNFILRAMIGMGENIYHPVLGKKISQIYNELHSNKKTFKIPRWLLAKLLHNDKKCITCKHLFNQG